MASTWAARLPMACIPQGADPKQVTFVIPYYENPQFLRRQLGWWWTFPAWLRAQLTAIVVDDGSPTEPAAAAIRALAHPFPLRLFRIGVDIPWNWLAARNIGMEETAPGWCVLTDIDHVIPASTAMSLVFGRHEAGVIYAFSRIEHTGESISPHSASFFLTREMFWRVGGYDERLAGNYGTDGLFRRQCASVAPMQVLPDRLIRHEYQADSSTSRYPRKLPADAEAVRRLVAARGPDWTPLTLSFPYAEVTR